MGDVTWVPVVGSSQYEVSSDGRVRGIDRDVDDGRGRRRRLKGKELSPGLNGSGYQHVVLTRDGKRRISRRIHQIVCEAFNGPPPADDSVVRHLNDNRVDNRAENLAWGTRSENTLDSIRNGLHAEAKKTRCKWGHPFDGQKTYRNGRPRRTCITCSRAAAIRHSRQPGIRDARRKWYAEYYQAHREEILARRRFLKAGGQLIDLPDPDELETA